MVVLLITDSVSLPRKYDGGEVLWDEIYFSKLEKAFPQCKFVLMAIGGATITQLQISLKYYMQVKPDLVILQAGIVDCAPRALGQLEQEVIKKMHLFRLVKPMTKLLRKYRRISYTKPKLFEQTLIKIKNIFAGKPLIAIGILPGCDEYDKLVPGISKKIELYNGILAKHSIFIDNKNFQRQGIIQDFHHINKLGHLEIFNKLQQEIKKLMNEKDIEG